MIPDACAVPVQRFVTWVEATRVAVFVSENRYAFPWLECVHVMAICLVVGAIAIVDLRLMGVAGRSYRANRLLVALLPMTWGAFLVAAVTGSLMFTTQPGVYLANSAFQIKLALLVVSAVNVAAFHLWTGRWIGKWDDTASIPIAVRIAGFISLCTWLGVVFAGRFVGFTIDAFGATC